MLEFLSWTSVWKQQKLLLKVGRIWRKKNQETFQCRKHKVTKRCEMAEGKEMLDNKRERRGVEWMYWMEVGTKHEIQSLGVV